MHGSSYSMRLLLLFSVMNNIVIYDWSSFVCYSVSVLVVFFFFSSRRRHTRCSRDWSSDVCSSDLWPGRADPGDAQALQGVRADHSPRADRAARLDGLQQHLDPPERRGAPRHPEARRLRAGSARHSRARDGHPRGRDDARVRRQVPPGGTPDGGPEPAAPRRRLPGRGRRVQARVSAGDREPDQSPGAAADVLAVSVTLTGGARPRHGSPPLLTVNELTKKFGGFTALNSVSFDVREGEILGLIGPNGSGKTTCFNCISGALTPTAGSIRFDDVEMRGLTPDAGCHRGIARTFQIPRPFRKLSIVDNVAGAAHYGGRTAEASARARARDVLALLGLSAEADAAPTLLGAGGLKKLELARALATAPRLLLADESLGGLDPTEMASAADMLRRVRGELGVTIVWVEHIMATLMRVVGCV